MAPARNRSIAASAFCFFLIEMGIRFGQQFLDSLAMPAINADSDTGGQWRLLRIHFHDVANAAGHAFRFCFFRLRQHKSKFVSAIAGGGVNRAAVNAQDVRNAAQSAAANQVAVGIVDFLKAVEIKKQNTKRPVAAVGAFSLAFEFVKKAAIVGQTGQRITDGEMVYLFEESRVIKQSATQRNGR